MLQAIRDKAQGWIAWAIVILISIPFALWGIQEYLGLGKEPVVATVAGTEITQSQLERRVLAERDRLRESLGESYDPDMFPETVLSERMREQLINEAVLRHTADQWGLRVGDEMLKGYIRSQKFFQDDGRFDPQLYENVLRNNGFSRARYEQTTRQELISTQLQTSLVNSVFTTDRELSESARLLQQQREIDFVRIKAQDYAEAVQPSDEELQDFYARNSSAYTLPERVKVAYLVLDLDTVAERITVDEEVLRSHFQLTEDQYRIPEERQVRHILIKADDSNREQALAEAESLRARLQAGEDFAALAREASDDPGSAGEGGELGWVQRGMMVEAFEKAAFELAKGVVSEPVLSPYGYHLIEVTEVRDSAGSDFEDVRAEVERSYRRQEAENLYFDYAERLADVAYENPDSLKPAAEELGLEVETSDWFSRGDAPEPLASPKVIGAIFSDEVLVQGLNSERIEVEPEHSIVLRVLEHETSRLQSLDEVRDQLVDDYRRQQSAVAARAAGEAALGELKDGLDLAALAERHGWEIESPGAVMRGSPGLSRSLLGQVFRLPRPDAEKPIYGGVALENGDYAVIALRKVEDGTVDGLEKGQRDQLAGQLKSQLAQGEFNAVLGELRSAADIERISE